jgi:hypothetical protein
MAPVPTQRGAVADATAVAAYKGVLQRVLDNRPSGTRYRLAAAMGKNRSFISQITNPAYLVPIPATHLDALFEICHFSSDERREFLEAYSRAHPRRLRIVATDDNGGQPQKLRTITLAVPDLGDARRNRIFEETLADFARRMAHLARNDTDKR